MERKPLENSDDSTVVKPGFQYLTIVSILYILNFVYLPYIHTYKKIKA